MANRLPGDLDPTRHIERIIRVNHAGEYGAKRIYEGQLAILKHSPSRPLIEHMAEQEARHLQYFEQQIVKRRIRPTLLSPVWHMAGFMLGAATALLGEKAAMACTVAVEEVIDDHYQKQLLQLDNQEAELKEQIAQFQAEENEHKATALEHKAKEAPAYTLLTQTVKTASRVAIWLSSRI